MPILNEALYLKCIQTFIWRFLQDCVFCIILNSSGPSHETVKAQPMFQRCTEKVVFSTVFWGLSTSTAKNYGISCPQSDLKKLLQGTVASFQDPSIFGDRCPHCECGCAWVRWFELLPAQYFPVQILFLNPVAVLLGPLYICLSYHLCLISSCN